MSVQAQRAGRACGPAQLDAFGLARGQSLFGARADEVALDLGHQAENGGDDLGLHRVVEDDAVFRYVQVDPTLDALAANLKHLQRRAREARDFRDHDHIALPCPRDQLAQRAGAPIGLAAGRVLDKDRL